MKKICDSVGTINIHIHTTVVHMCVKFETLMQIFVVSLT